MNIDLLSLNTEQIYEYAKKYFPGRYSLIKASPRDQVEVKKTEFRQAMAPLYIVEGSEALVRAYENALDQDTSMDFTFALDDAADAWL